MKRLLLFPVLMAFLLSFAHLSFAQRIETIPMSEGTVFVSQNEDFNVVVTKKNIYFGLTFDSILSYRSAFTAPDGKDIVDARFKLSFGSRPDVFLVLLSDGTALELLMPDDVEDPVRVTTMSAVAFAQYEFAMQFLGDDLYMMTDRAVYVTRDSGQSWIIDTAGLNSPSQYNDADIDTLQNVWLTTSNGLHKQALVSSTWFPVTGYTAFSADEVHVDRQQRIWVSSFNQIYVSSDGGTTFPSGPSGLFSSAILEITDDIFGNIYVIQGQSYGNGNKVYRSTGGTAAFVQVDMPVMTHFAGFSTEYIYNDISADTSVMLATAAGLYKSTDQGATWTFEPSALAERVYSTVATASGRILMTTAGGLYGINGSGPAWTKLHPTAGFTDQSMVYRTTSGDIYLLAENTYANSGGGSARMVYKSTNNGDTFAPDTAGMFTSDVVMSVFMIDEHGTQHAGGGTFNAGPGTMVWKKEPGQPWTLDTTGLSITSNHSVKCFGTDNAGNVYVVLYDFNSTFSLIFKRANSASGWTADGGLNSMVHNISGHSGKMIAGTDAGLARYNAGSWTFAPHPPGITAGPNYGPDVFTATVAPTGVVWAYFESEDQDLGGRGRGIWYTTDFVTWSQPAGNVDTVLFANLSAIGDSVFAMTLDNSGVYVFDTGSGPVGIDKHNAVSALKIYPNPASGYVTLEIPGIVDGEVQLFDVTGKAVTPAVTAGSLMQINLPNGAAGIYFIQYRSASAMEMIKVSVME